MAETVLGRAASLPRVPAGASESYTSCREASREASKRYRAACRRAGRAVFAKNAAQKAAVLLVALSKAATPFRTLAAAVVYGAAGVAEGIRAHTSGKSFHLERAKGETEKKTNHIRANTALAFLAAGVLIFTASIYRVGLEVILDGESIGYVGSQSVVENSLGAVSERAAEILGHPYAVSPDIRYRFSIVNKNRLFDGKGVEEGLLASISDIDRLCVLTIDGVVVAAAREPSTLNAAIDAILDRYPAGGDKRFLQDVRIESQLASVSLIRSADELVSELTRPVRDELYVAVSNVESAVFEAANHGISYDALRSLNPGVDFGDIQDGQSLLIQKSKPYLSVAYSVDFDYNRPIPFDTEYIDDPDLWEGTTTIVMSGVDGEEVVRAIRTSVDGYEPDEEITGSTIIIEPVTEVIAVGARKRYATGSFQRPSDGKLSSSFGMRTLFGRRQNHLGIDYAGRVGDPIYAADGGKVKYAEWKQDYGLCVIIDHENGFQTVYGHCSKILVEVGQMVGKGEQIAKVGNTGRSTGPHVHFEVLLNGAHKNPANYVNK